MVYRIEAPAEERWTYHRSVSGHDSARHHQLCFFLTFTFMPTDQGHPSPNWRWHFYKSKCSSQGVAFFHPEAKIGTLSVAVFFDHVVLCCAPSKFGCSNCSYRVCGQGSH
eukprot:5245737-Karenia_brevis.AAC.1